MKLNGKNMKNINQHNVNQKEEFKTVGSINTSKDVVMSVKDCNVFYGENQALKNINLEVGKSEVIALIGPSGCGKSTFLRCLNRLNDRVGMVFQKPNPFPKSIYENVAYGPKIHGITTSKKELDELVELSLDRAGLLDRIHSPGTSLSGGQQQRLCIARAIAIKPDVILMDEPCSALDPIATEKIEGLINELKENYAIVMVTHSMSQAARVSQRAAYFHLGNLIEVGDTKKIFEDPEHELTKNYIYGRTG